MTPESYYAYVRDTFRKQGNPDMAQMQMWYLRHQFDFFGLKMPQWTALAKAIHKEHGFPQGGDLQTLVRLCFDDDHREMQYFALETVQKALPAQTPDFIYFLEELICTKSWWDTVDWIAKLAGMHFRRYPELIRPVTEGWMASENMWLQRVSLIFQLLYKEKTDSALLFDYIRRLADSKEFFIRKAAGWALRQYSKTDPDAVRAFVQNNRLSPLTKREALKHLK